MSRQLFGDLDLGTLEPLVAGGAVVGGLLWVGLALFAYALRAPPRPPVGLHTLSLGPEPPAVANFLVNGFRVTREAIAATMLDLAARRVLDVEQRDLDEFFVRVRTQSAEGLASYERRVLAVVERRAVDGDAVPVASVTTGTEVASKEWRALFEAEVVADAQARGVAREALDRGAFGLLVAAAAIPAACAWAVWGIVPALVAVTAAAGLLGWLYGRHPQRETPAGLEAASRWLGVRAEIALNPVFDTQTPVTVALWNRLLAYGAALGVARGATGPLAFAAESDTVAWSDHGGRWREVRIAYPKLWPPGWGSEPSAALIVGLVAAGGGAYGLYASTPSLVEGGVSGALYMVALAVAVLVGTAVVIAAAGDLWTAAEVTGPVLRLRVFEQDDKIRYYAAIDDGVSEAITAFRVTEEQFEALQEGDLVTVRCTARLGRVRWILPATDPV